MLKENGTNASETHKQQWGIAISVQQENNWHLVWQVASLGAGQLLVNFCREGDIRPNTSWRGESVSVYAARKGRKRQAAEWEWQFTTTHKIGQKKIWLDIGVNSWEEWLAEIQ